MSWTDDLKAEPWRFSFYDVLRRIEREHADRPRIGNSATRREEYVELGQDPFLEFPASDLTGVQSQGDRLKIFARFLGLSGPQGALPLTTTDESLSWLLMRDDSFARTGLRQHRCRHHRRLAGRTRHQQGMGRSSAARAPVG